MLPGPIIAKAAGARGDEQEQEDIGIMSEPLDIRIDWDVCMGSGNCLFWAPDSFDLSDDGHAIVTDPAATDEERLRIAAEGCPTGAISLWRDGVQVFPEAGV